MTAPLIVDQVTVQYGALTALNGVSLSVPPASCVALLGTNGSGKSTLMRTIAGLVRPTRGELYFQTEPLSERAPHEIARMGVSVIPETGGVFPSLTVADNLRSFAAFLPEPVPTERVEGVLDLFPALRRRYRQDAKSLSGGEQQMLALARALIAGPSLVAIDEISTGLAPKVVDELFAVIRRITASGVAVLVAEQFVKLVLATADYAYVLRRGALAFAGDAGELADTDVLEHYLDSGL